MNVIHYIHGMPPLRKGGLPKYAVSLIEGQKRRGYDVKILVPGPFDRSLRTKIESWKKFNGIQSYQIFNALPVANIYGIREIESFIRPTPVNVFEDWLDKYRIDIIHVHSIMGLPLEFLEAAKKKSIKIVMTTHDFFGLCPKIDLMKGEVFCDECDWSKCGECCKNAYSVKKLQFWHSNIYWWYCNQEWLFSCVHKGFIAKFIKSLREKRTGSNENAVDWKENIDYIPLQSYYRKVFACVDFFHFNSGQTAEVFRKHLGEIPGMIIDIMNDDVQDNRIIRQYGDLLQLGYIGGKVQHKGFYYMADRLHQIYKGGRKDFICHTFMMEDTEEYPFMVNHGPYKYGEQKDVFNMIDVLVVPSMCRETYGMVVLEAISNGIPVIVSEYVGAKTLVEKYPGIGKIFPAEGEAFLNIVKEIYDNRSKLREMNQQILKMDYAFGMDSHVKKVEELYNCSKE